MPLYSEGAKNRRIGPDPVNLSDAAVMITMAAFFYAFKYIGITDPGKEEPMPRELLEALPDVLDAGQLAEVLHLSRSGAYNLLNKPDFPTLHVGGKKMVVKQALIEWMHRNTNAPKN